MFMALKKKKKAPPRLSAGGLELNEDALALNLHDSVEANPYIGREPNPFRPEESPKEGADPYLAEKIPERSRKLMESRGLTPEVVRERALSGSIDYYVDYINDLGTREFEPEVQDKLLGHAAYNMLRLRREMGCKTFREMGEKHLGRKFKASGPGFEVFALLDSMEKIGNVPSKPVYKKGEPTPLDDARLRDSVAFYANYIEDAQKNSNFRDRVGEFRRHAWFMLGMFCRQRGITFAQLAKEYAPQEHRGLIASLAGVEKELPDDVIALRAKLENARKAAGAGAIAEGGRASELASGKRGAAPGAGAKEDEVSKKGGKEKPTPERKWKEEKVGDYAASLRATIQFLVHSTDMLKGELALANLAKTLERLKKAKEELGAKTYAELAAYIKKHMPKGYKNLEQDTRALRMLDSAEASGDFSGSIGKFIGGWREKVEEKAEKDMIRGAIAFYSGSALRDFRTAESAKKPLERKRAAWRAMKALHNLDALRSKLGLASISALSEYTSFESQKKELEEAAKLWDAGREEYLAELASGAPKEGEKLSREDRKWYISELRDALNAYAKSEKVRDDAKREELENYYLKESWRLAQRLGAEKFSDLEKYFRSERQKSYLALMDKRLSRQKKEEAGAAPAEVAMEGAPKKGPMVPRSRPVEKASEEEKRRFVADTMVRLMVEDTSHYLSRTLEEGMRSHGFKSFAEMAAYADKEEHKRFLRELGETADVEEFLKAARKIGSESARR